MALGGGQYTVTASAVNVTTALGMAQKIHCKCIQIQGKTGNTGITYIGASNVTNAPANAMAQVPATSTWTSGYNDGSPINTDEVFIVGTAADVVFITLIE